MELRSRLTGDFHPLWLVRGWACGPALSYPSKGIVVQSCLTLWPHGLQHSRLPCPSLSLRVCSNWRPLSHWCPLSDHLILCHPFFLLPSIFPRIRVFSNELAFCIRWSKYWSFSFSPSNEYSGLISFRTDWFDLLAVQGTLKSLLLHHSLKASVLWCSAVFIVQLSHPYMTTGKKHRFDYADLCQQSNIYAF